MFFGLQWYWWLVIVAILIVLKVGLLKQWSKHQQKQQKDQHGKWGDEE